MSEPLDVVLSRTPPAELGDQRFDHGRPAVMAIINRTRDSFYEKAGTGDLGQALATLDRHLAHGADIIDVGGVRAGQEGEWVDADAEVARVLPFLEAARERHPGVLLSLDTWRAEVAQRCAHVGIALINDTWAGADPELVAVAAALDAGYVVSATGGLPPRTDPVDVSYGPHPDDVVRSVLAELAAGAQRAVDAGVRPRGVLVDPTLDFGKTTRNSLRVLRATGWVAGLGFPVLQAISRKDFVGETLDLPASERLEGSLAATAIAAWLGATVFRTHDVAATKRALAMTASVRGDRPPTVAVRGEPGSRSARPD